MNPAQRPAAAYGTRALKVNRHKFSEPASPLPPFWLIMSWVLISIVAASPIFFRNGSIAFLHDWTLPPTRVQMESSALHALRLWIPDGFGMPNFYLNAFPFDLIQFAASVVVSAPSFAFVVVAFAMFSASYGAYSMFWEIAAQGGEKTASFLYGCSPFFLNEFAAGHLTELLAYSILPWFIRAVVRCHEGVGRQRNIVLPALLAVSMCSLAQYFIIVAMVLALSILIWKKAKESLSIFSLLLLSNLATVTLYFLSSPRAFLSVDLPLLHWEASLSSFPLPALAAMGYAPGYAEHAYGVAYSFVQYSLAGLAIAGITAVAFASSKGMRAQRLLWIAGIIGIVATMGLNGPLSFLFAWLFTTVGDSAVVRELYHFAALIPFTWLCGIATLRLVRSRSTRVFMSYVGVALCICMIGAFMLGKSLDRSGTLPRRDIEAWSSVVRRISVVPTSGYVLLLPVEQPMAPLGAPYAGTDPEAFSIGAHPVISDFEPTPMGEFAKYEWEYSGARAARNLAALGIQYVAIRNDWRSDRLSRLEPSLQAIVTHCIREKRDSGKVSFSPFYSEGAVSVFADPEYSDVLYAARSWLNPPSGLPGASELTDDPRDAWVAGQRWADCYPKLASMPFASLFTLSRQRLRLKLTDAARYLWIWAPSGAYIEQRGARTSITKARFTPVPMVKFNQRVPITIVPLGPTAVLGFSSGPRVQWWLRTSRTRRTGYVRVEPRRASRLIFGDEKGRADGAFPAVHRTSRRGLLTLILPVELVVQYCVAAALLFLAAFQFIANRKSRKLIG